MSVVVLVLTLAVIAVAAGLFVAMFVKDKPFYGVLALGMLLGPGTALTFTYVALG